MTGYFNPIRQWLLKQDPRGGKAVADALETWIKPGGVALSDLGTIATDRLLGRDTAGTGSIEQLTVSGGLEFTGSGGLQTSAFTGDATKAAGGTALTLSTTGVTAATYGDATHVGQFAVDAKGRISSASNVPITFATPNLTSSTGIVVQTGGASYAARTLTGPAAGITVSNGSGVSGNPTLALANDLAALEALSGTNTMYYRSGVDTWSAVTFSGLTFSGGVLSGGAASGSAYERVVTVAKSGGQFTSVQAAIDSITDAAEAKRYLVWIAPGKYTEQVTMKSWVDLRGASKHDVQLTFTGNDNGTVILASHVQVEDLLIEESNTASEWAIVGSDTSQVGIRNVDILGVAGGSQVSQGIKITGNTWATVFIEHCVINYLGTGGWGIYLTGNGTTPQNADLHINDTFVDSLNATTGGSVYYKDLFAGRVRGGLYRTKSGSGTDFTTARTAGTVDLLLEGVTAEFGSPSVSIAASTTVYKKHSTIDTYSGSGTLADFDGPLDGDKGDITVSSGGTVFSLDNDVVTNAKLRNSGALSVIGRSANSTGDPADISATAASGAVLRESGSALGFGTIATAGIANSAVTLAKIANAAANSKLLGSGASGSGSAYAEITLGTNLSMSGTTLNATGGGSLSDGDYGDITVSSSGAAMSIDNDVVTFAKMQNVSANSVPARAASSSGDLSEVALSASQLLGRGSTGDIAAIALGSNLSMSGTTLSASGTVSGSGGLIGVQVITATGSGTYTPTSGTSFIIIELQAGGGGGGGVSSPGASKSSLGGGGGGGSWLRKKLTANFSGASYSVGAKGTGGAAGNNAGNTGGNTTFTTTGGSPVTYTAGGGAGGASIVALTPPLLAAGGTGGGATNGDVYRAGEGGGAAASWSTFVSYGGRGGTSMYSSGVPENILQNGSANTQAAGVNDVGGYGGGGSGAVAVGTGTAQAGGNGTDGLIIIWEFS